MNGKALYTPITGPVIGTTAYFDGKLVARDAGLTLPEVAPKTATLQMMGEMEFPIWQLIQNMQAIISKVGVDILSQTMIGPELKPIEFRWVQMVKRLDGSSAEVGCKAFMNGLTASIPGYGIEVGSPSENDNPFNLMRYRLVIDGQETVLIDRIAGKVVINGKDYTKNMNSML